MIRFLPAGLLGLLLPAVAFAQPAEGKRYALLVGVQKYDGSGLTNLKYAEKDMADLKVALDPLGYRVTLMTKAEYRRTETEDIDPTAENVLAQLKKIARLAKAEDTVVVAFSGHGVHLKGPDKLFYCPSKPNLDKPETLVAVDDILAALKPYDEATQLGCRAGAKVVLMDACRNDPTDGKAVNDKLKSATLPLVPDPPGGTVALFSCSKGQISHESETFQRGFLTHFVIDGLSGKAANKAGELSWDKLVAHVKEEVPAAVLDQKGAHASQLPESKGQASVLSLGRRKYESDLTGGFRLADFGKDGSVRAIVRSVDFANNIYDVRAVDPLTGRVVAGPFAVAAAAHGHAFSPDGTKVVLACGDKTVSVWDAGTSKVAAGPFTLASFANYAAFSPDGKQILVVSDNTAAVWDAATGKVVAGPFNHASEVRHAAFSPDGTKVVTASMDKTAAAWDVATGKKLAEFTHADEVEHAAFDPYGAKVVTASRDNTAAVWDVATGKMMTRSLKHADWVRHAVFSPDGTKVLTASKEGLAAVWDAKTGATLAVFTHAKLVRHAAFSADGSKVVTASFDETASVWDATTGKRLAGPFAHGKDKGVYYAAFSPDGSKVVTSSADSKTATVWNAKTGEKLGSVTTDPR